jgi:hypothetical protein
VHSIFELWDADSSGDLEDLCEGPLSPVDHSTLEECLGEARTVLVEREYIDKDYRNAYSSYYSKKFSRLSSRAVRLHLFNVVVTEEMLLDASFVDRLMEASSVDVEDEDRSTTPGYIGFVVLRPTPYSRIGRCILDPARLKRPWTEATRGCATRFKANVMGHTLDVRAFPHMSQDTEVHTCAQTAVWSLFRYLSRRYTHYPESYPHDIAMLNDDLRCGRPLPGRGLYMDQITAMFGRFGLAAEMYTKDEIAEIVRTSSPSWAAIQDTGDLKPDDDRMLMLLHWYLDSGMPPVLGVPGHAVVAFGVDYADSPQVGRPGRIVPATDYVTSIVANDDNHAPYQRVLRAPSAKPTYGVLDVDAAVVPMPDKVYLTADQADQIATDILAGFDPEDCFGNDTVLVRRLFCTSSKNYKTFRRAAQDPVTRLLLKQPMPHFVWIAEYCPIDEWRPSAPRFAIEVVLDATAGRFDAQPFLWVRDPGQLVVNWPRLYGGAENLEAEWFEINTGVQTMPAFDGNLEAYA